MTKRECCEKCQSSSVEKSPTNVTFDCHIFHSEITPNFCRAVREAFVIDRDDEK